MKRNLLLIGILIFNLNSVFGQICGTPHLSNPTIYPQENNTEFNEFSSYRGSSSAICINVFFHVVRNTNGTNAFPVPNTNNITAMLNDFYSPHNIIISNLGTNFIDNSNFLQVDEGEHTTLMNSGFDVPNAINYYIVEEMWDVYRNGVYQGFVTGAADAIPSNSLVIRSDRVLSSTSHHEVGHCLNLYHTFHGSIAENIPNSCAENINGTNCNSCGDYVCDTPADQNLQNMNGYSPDLTNIMSYYNNRDHFTNGQGYRMRLSINSETILQNIKSTSCTQISEVSSNLCYPQTTTITLTNLGGASTFWSSSSNVQIMSHNNSSATIGSLNQNTSGEGWIRASLSNGIVLQENFWVGRPLLNYDIYEDFTMCRDINTTTNNFFPVSMLGMDVSTTWEVQRITNNHNVSMQGNEVLVSLQYAAPYNYIAFKVRANNLCGFSDWLEYYIEVFDSCGLESNNSYMIYPNPATEFITIRAKKPKDIIESRIRFKMYDLNGILVEIGILSNQSSIDVSKYNKGNYILKIDEGSNSETHHIIIK